MMGMLPISFRMPPMYAKIRGKSTGFIGTLVFLIWKMRCTSIFTMEFAISAPFCFGCVRTRGLRARCALHPRLSPWVVTHGCLRGLSPTAVPRKPHGGGKIQSWGHPTIVFPLPRRGFQPWVVPFAFPVLYTNN